MVNNKACLQHNETLTESELEYFNRIMLVGTLDPIDQDMVYTASDTLDVAVWTADEPYWE